MAGPKSGSRGHPRRVLAFILVVTAVLYAVMFATGDKTPRLGIDLAGGTSVTLTAKPDQGGNKNAVNARSLETAVSIIRQRVNAFGVSEAEVQTEGDRNIVINIPKGKGEDQTAAQVGKTAKLFFRPVIEIGQPTPLVPPAATPPPAGGTPPPASTPPASTPPAPSPSATASATGKPQGRVIPQLKAADPTPAPGPTNQPLDLTSPSAGQPDPNAPQTAPGADDANWGITPELRQRFNELDCTKPEGRLNVNATPPEQPTVACSQDTKGDDVFKYILAPAAVDGVDLTSAEAELPQGMGWQVAMKFNGKGADKFTKVTTELSQGKFPTQQFAIELDNQVVSAPNVDNPIPGGQAVINGSFTQKETKDLANVLKFGSLPLSFTQSEVTKVSASLGGEQLRGGLIAGGIGVILIILYCLGYYRGLGLVAISSLAVSGLLTYAIMCLLGRGIGFALNLPAVVGAIAAIGITVDSFIVYFERIRDEIREGRSLRPAVEAAWPRARRTILVSDFVSFLAAAVLYFVSVGKVKGFAFTLGLTTLLDIVVVFLFTKPLMTILAEKKFFANGHKWSGLDPAKLGAANKRSYRKPRSRRAPVAAGAELPKEA